MNWAWNLKVILFCYISKVNTLHQDCVPVLKYHLWWCSSGEWLIKEENKKVKGHLEIPEFSFGELEDLEVKTLSCMKLSTHVTLVVNWIDRSRIMTDGSRGIVLLVFCFVSGKRNIKRGQGSVLGWQSSNLQGYEVLPFTYPGEAARVWKGAER